MNFLTSAPGNSRIHQILEMRKRAHFDYREAEIGIRLKQIKRAYRGVTPNQTEILRYFPVALIASVESFVRMATKELIDHGEPYLGNAESLIRNEKFDYDALKYMHGQLVTIGDLVSQQLRLSDLSKVLTTMKKLMDCDIKEKLSGVIERWDVEVEGNPRVPIIADIDTTFRHVSETFRLRHIFCHEIASRISVTKEEIDKCVQHTVLFLDAFNCLIQQTLYPNSPLTQADINVAAANDYLHEKAILDNQLLEINQELSNKQRALLEIANAAWETFVEVSVEIEGLQYEGGTIRPTIENSAAAQFTRERQQHLKDLVTLVKAN